MKVGTVRTEEKSETSYAGNDLACSQRMYLSFFLLPKLSRIRNDLAHFSQLDLYTTMRVFACVAKMTLGSVRSTAACLLLRTFVNEGHVRTD